MEELRAMSPMSKVTQLVNVVRIKIPDPVHPTTSSVTTSLYSS